MTILDRWGEPIPTRVVRKRMGFIGGDHLPDDDMQNEPPTFSAARDGREPRERWNGHGYEEEAHG